MKKDRLFLVSAVVILLAFTMILMAQDTPAYVGAEKCKMCHKGEKKGMIFEQWEGEKHAHALQPVLDEGEGENSLCLGCHTTGHGAGGYDPASETKDAFAGVQCEACHGPGSLYKKMSVMKDRDAAIAAGLNMPTEETCLQCHNNSHHEDMTFDYKEAWKQIEHRIPEEASE
ncbi:cytochrome c family protein [bacterium]|nr:cytochrome c family protein [bacterium]MBU1652749.1 cytochrome c family protein [bacterium]MBU1881199.1 cytochrome c family protein [bacterium]